MQHNNLFNLYSQHHSCWWPGDARIQGNSSHGMDFIQNIPVSASQGLMTHLQIATMVWHWDAADDSYKLAHGHKQLCEMGSHFLEDAN